MKKIIIAEDIQAILARENSFLNRSDIKVFTTTSNEEVMALHRNEIANLIITKLDTSKMTGKELSSLIRNDKELCNVSIIMVHTDTESDAKRCLECRANVFIPSPINNMILLKKVHQLLNVAPRKSLRVPLSIEIHVTSIGNPFMAYAENISTSGMLLHSETLLFVGDIITCGFYLPDSIHITTHAEIMRVVGKATEHDTNGYGIRFIDLSTRFNAAIEAFVRKEKQ